jgi:2'-5' RNA ligase
MRNRILECFPSPAEPHVTVKAQGGLGSDVEWVDRMRAAVARFGEVEVELGDPQTFGDGVVSLAAHGERLAPLHRLLVGVARPTRPEVARYFELDAFTPHLTLAQGEDLDIEAALATARSLARLGVFTCRTLTIFRRTAADETYAPFAELSLLEPQA